MLNLLSDLVFMLRPSNLELLQGLFFGGLIFGIALTLKSIWTKYSLLQAIKKG